MTLTRRQRYSVIVLLVALAALALDKLLLSSTPEAALAGVRSEDVAANSGDDSPSQHEGTAALAERLLARRTARRPLSGGTPTLNVPVLNAAPPDIFSWDRLAGTDGTAGISAAAELNGLPAHTAEAFQTAHRLKATLLGPQPMALIDDRTYRVGDALDDFVLTAVRADEAVFVSGDRTVVLSVPSPWNREESPTP